MPRILAGIVVILAAADFTQADDGEDKAVELLKDRGGYVTRAEDQPGKPVIGVDLSFKRVTDDDLKQIARLTHLTELNLAFVKDDDTFGPSYTPVTDAGLKHLTPLKGLSKLRLNRAKVTNTGLKYLAKCESLTEVDLSETNVTSAGLSELAPLKKLKKLYLPGIDDETLQELSKVGLIHTLPEAWKDRDLPDKPQDVTKLDLLQTDVTDAGMTHLASFESLALLRAPHRLTDAGLKHLAPFAKLKYLNLQGTGVTDAGLKEISRLKNLVDLNLSDTPVTGTGLKDLAPLKQLTVLDLNDSKITDEGLKNVAPLTSVTTLCLFGTGVTDAGVKSIAQLKGLKAVYLGGSKVTGVGLKDLAPLTKLTFLDVDPLDDAKLVELGNVNLLHALRQARGDAPRPTKPGEVLELDLSDTQVTAAGLKALAPLKSLVVLAVPRIDDKTLLELAKINLLHALLHGQTADGNPSAKPEDIIQLDLSDTEVTAKGIIALKPFKNLTTLALPQIDNATLMELAKINLLHALPQATTVELNRPMTPKEVITLDLGETSVTAEGLEALASLENLAQLRLPEIDDKTLSELGKIQLLRALHEVRTATGELPAKPDDVIGLNLSETKVTAAGLKELKPLKNLITLDLPKIDDQTLVELRKINLLHALPHATTAEGSRPATATLVSELDLAGTELSDKGLKELAAFTNLTTLVLSGKNVTDEGLKDLAALKGLTKLQFIDTGVTDLGIQKLQKQLPKCEISR